MDHHPTRWRKVSGRRPAMGDQALVAALRCQDEGALREFFLRFRPALLVTARRLGVDPGEVESVVDDCLADVAVHLIASDAPAPRSLPAYLARSVRNRVLNAARSRGRAERHLGAEMRSSSSESRCRPRRRCRRSRRRFSVWPTRSRPCSTTKSGSWPSG